MHVQPVQQPTKRRSPSALAAMNSNRWTAVAIWLVGTWLSRSALIQFGVRNLVAATSAALLVQWFLTKGQQRIWRKGADWSEKFTLVSVSALVIDVAFNATGAWPYVRNLGRTDMWRMLQEMTATSAAPSLLIVGSVCVLVGLFIAGAVEYFWNLEA